MSINTAVTNSASGDTVHVDSGTYTLASELRVKR